LRVILVLDLLRHFFRFAVFEQLLGKRMLLRIAEPRHRFEDVENIQQAERDKDNQSDVSLGAGYRRVEHDGEKLRQPRSARRPVKPESGIEVPDDFLLDIVWSIVQDSAP